MSGARPTDRTEPGRPSSADEFRAFVVTRSDGADVESGVRDLGASDLPAGEVTVRVEWSSINYKDAMTTRPGNRVARISPLVPGVDLVGTVTASDDSTFAIGSRSDRPRLRPRCGPSRRLRRVRAGARAWVVPLPAGSQPA